MSDSAVKNPARTDTYGAALLVTVSVFFFWGFAASGNALLIPVLKQKFSLQQFQSQLVELSFYLAYFAGSLLYFGVAVKKADWLQAWDTRNVMITGLIISALGTLMLNAAAGTQSYFFLLVSLFVIAFGFSFQQIIANPLLVTLGDESSGAQRLLLAGAVNSFGNTIAPLVLSYFIFGNVATASTDLSLVAIRPLFYGLAFAYVLFAVGYAVIPLPAASLTPADKVTDMGALRFPQLVLGMIAIFCYVGSEVAIQGNLPALVASDEGMGLPAKDAIHYFSLFGGSLLIGRWTGALFNFKLAKPLQNVLVFVVPLIGFGVVLGANWLKGTDLGQLTDYLPFIFLVALVLVASRQEPATILAYASVASLGLIAVSFGVSPKMSMYCLIAVATFSALMWPCIFALAIRGLGKYRQQGSSLLIMMIVGGAILPPLQGLLSDQSGVGIHRSFIVPAVAFAYIAWFAFRMGRKE